MPGNQEQDPDTLNYMDVIAQVDQIFQRLQQEIPPGRLSFKQIDELLEGLPDITEKQIIASGDKDSTCPICFTTYLAIIAEAELASAMDSPATPLEHHGVTKLDKSWQCGHMFCKRDISKWIRDGHDSCPLCRRLLVENSEPRSTSDESNGSRLARPLTPPQVLIGEPGGLEDALRQIHEQLASAGGGFGFFHPPPGSGNDEEPAPGRVDSFEYSTAMFS